jgi:hypothetical protein
MRFSITTVKQPTLRKGDKPSDEAIRKAPRRIKPAKLARGGQFRPPIPNTWDTPLVTTKPQLLLIGLRQQNLHALRCDIATYMRSQPNPMVVAIRDCPLGDEAIFCRRLDAIANKWWIAPLGFVSVLPQYQIELAR